jgi:hypothetical protein
MKQIMIVALLCLTFTSYAAKPWYLNPWTTDAAFGLSYGASREPTPLGRFSIGHGLYSNFAVQLGLEVGIQSGSSLLLQVDREAVAALGGLPIYAELKPLLDVLLNAKTLPVSSMPLFAWVKGGIAYRQLCAERSDLNQVKAMTPELQLGLGYQVNALIAATLGYQYLWGRPPELSVTGLSDAGRLRYLPAQQVVLLGFAYAFL